MRHADWGVLSPRWAGVRSREIDVCGTSVHYLTAGAERDGPVHLLVHPMAGAASLMPDVIAAVGAFGPVVAPDLPGTVFGHTRTPHPRAAKAEPNARFLRAFTARLGIRDAVVHGWSMGGLVAVLFAALAPERVARLVLAAPALPGPLPREELLFWRTAGRVLLVAGPPIARGVLKLTGRRLLELKLRMLTEPADWSGEVIGGDLSRISPETSALLSEVVRGARPARLGYAVTALSSTMSAMFVRPEPVHRAIGECRAPALLLWGDEDQLATRAMVDDVLRRRPDWELRVFEGFGHVFPLETPTGYAEAVDRWMSEGLTDSG